MRELVLESANVDRRVSRAGSTARLASESIRVMERALVDRFSELVDTRDWKASLLPRSDA